MISNKDLIISRADVVSTHIIEDLPNRFIKVPITAYLDSIDIEPVASQIAIINALNKYRFVVAAISRRQGKTYIANIIGQCVLLVPGSNVLIMSPNYSLSQISFELQRKLIKHHMLEVEKDNAKDKVIELANGSTIRMGSVNQVDSVVGRSYDLIIFDEAALTSEGMNAFNVALRPTLDKDNSKAIFVSTPRGKTNWFAKFFERGFSDKFPEWCSIKATWRANPRVSEQDVMDAKASMSLPEFEQEYEASFNSYEGQIWRLNDDCVKEHKYTPDNDRHKLDIVAGLDLGFKDATAMVIIGYSYEDEMFYVLDEYYNDEGALTSAHAANIQAYIDKWDIDYIYIDSAAQQTRYDFAREYDIATMNAKKSVLDGIGYIGSLVDNNKIIVPPHCTRVLEAFDAYRWDPNPNLVKEKPIHDDSSHMADALRYALYSYETGTVSM
jgi:phage terminase large subunit